MNDHEPKHVHVRVGGANVALFKEMTAVPNWEDLDENDESDSNKLTAPKG